MSEQAMTPAEDHLVEIAPGPPPGRPWRLVIGDTSRSHGYDLLPVGTAVMVKTQYLGSWTNGFVVAEQLEDGYGLERTSDGSRLPGHFARSAVRRDIDAD